jgi:hypothetical protein
MGVSNAAPSWSLRACLWGFVIGAAGPVGLGIKLWHDFDAYAASVKADGHEAVCGLPLLLPLMLFVVVAPVCGLIGAAITPGIVWLWTSCAVSVETEYRSLLDE